MSLFTYVHMQRSFNKQTAYNVRLKTFTAHEYYKNVFGYQSCQCGVKRQRFEDQLCLHQSKCEEWPNLLIALENFIKLLVCSEHIYCSIVI
jgi:hypothetical protein